MDQQLIFDTPFWLWLLIAALLGAAAMWAYWRCLVDENEALAEAAIAEREDELARIQADFDANPLGRASTETADASAAALLSGDTDLDAPDGARAGDDDETAALRYRVWALETRLRRIQDGLQAGEPVDPALISEGWEAVDGDGAPPREVAELKYAAWRAERRTETVWPADGPDASINAEATELNATPKGAPAEPGAAAALAARADRLSRRVDQAIAAGKAGRTQELHDIERAMATEKPSTAAQYGAAFEPIGDGDPQSLRFRNWLLSSTLTRVLEQARSGWKIEPDLVTEELESASRGAAHTQMAFATQSEDAEEADEAEIEQALYVAELQENAEALADHNSGLRYRVWMLGRGLDPETGEPISATPQSDDDELLELMQLELDDAQREQERLRAELAQTQAAAAALPVAAFDETRLSELRSEADKLRARLRMVEEENVQLFNDKRAALDASAEATRRARAERDAAAQLRKRAAQAEYGLRGQRLLNVGSSTLSADLADARAEAARLESALAASDARLWSAEWRLANARSRIAAHAGASADRSEFEALEAELQRFRAEGPVLRSRLWASEWRLKQAAKAVQHRQQLKAQLAAAENRPAPAPVETPIEDPRQQMELQSLRVQLADLQNAQSAQINANVQELELRQRELEALRSRLTGAEAEAAELRRQLESRPAAPTLAPALAVAPPQAMAISTPPAPAPRPDPQISAAPAPIRVERTVAYVAPTATQVATPTQTVENHVRLRLRRELEPARQTPIWGVESAALELIDDRTFTAISANRPKCLLDSPNAGAPDDLTLIAHITLEMADMLRKSGLYYFHQLEECSPSDLAWIDDRLALSGAVVRDRWAPQARQLAEWKRDSRLTLSRNGYWSVTEMSFETPQPASTAAYATAPAPVAPPAPAPQPVAAPAPHSVAFDGPMSGAEYAMLDMIADPMFDARDAAKPAELRQPEIGGPDDLTRINGVDHPLAIALAGHNVTTYRRIAEMTPQSGAWLDRRLELGGRIPRERWQPQARLLEEMRAAGAFGAAPTAPLAAPLAPEPIQIAPAQPAPIPAVAAPIVAPNMMEIETSDPIAAAKAREEEAGRLIYAGAVSAQGPTPMALADGASIDGQDDLKLIQSIGPKLEARLNALGVYNYGQLARLSAAELAWLDQSLNLNGKTSREGWASQAVELEQRKVSGEMSIGGDGTWTLQMRGQELDEALEAARTSAYLPVEVDAMRLISGELPNTATTPPLGLLEAPSGASPDDLKLIRGVGPTLERVLNDLGVYYFRQIAAFTAQDLAWVDGRLNFKGRIIRDRWAPQAALLAQR